MPNTKVKASLMCWKNNKLDKLTGAVSKRWEQRTRSEGQVNGPVLTDYSLPTSWLTAEVFKNLEQEFSCYQLQETFEFLDLSRIISNMPSTKSLHLPCKFKEPKCPRSYGSRSNRGNTDKKKTINCYRQTRQEHEEKNDSEKSDKRKSLWGGDI